MDSSLRAESARPTPPCWTGPTVQHPEQGIVSTSAVHHITAGRSVSPFNDGDFPRGDPEAYFVEPDEIEAGPGLLRGLFASQRERRKPSTTPNEQRDQHGPPPRTLGWGGHAIT
jgi:hypothetical protein